MKTIIRPAALCIFLLVLFACAGSKEIIQDTEQAETQPQTAESAYSNDSVTLDAAIDAAASYFTRRLGDGAKVALVSFDAPTGRLSDYIVEDLWERFEDSQKFVMVDRKNLDRIDTETKYQLESGRVDDKLAVSITKQYGAEIIVFGQMSSLDQSSADSEYRLSIYATDVEKATSSQRAFVIRPDKRLASLLNVSLEDEVDRAVVDMGCSLDQQTTIAIGRICYSGTQTVSAFSALIKNSIISSAQKYRDKFLVAAETESVKLAVASRGLTVEAPVSDSGIQAVITGSYTPLDGGAEVTLQLVSTGANKLVLASPKFVIPAAELERRKLSLLPEKGNVSISLSEFKAKQEALAPYTGGDNQWSFTVTPDVLDGIYYDGDFMSMCIYSEKDCYFRVIHIDVNGNTQVIYPVAAKDNNFIRAGETRRIPDNTLYLMGPPFGEEIILAAAYDKPFTIAPSSGTAPLSPEIITRSFSVKTNDDAPMDPCVTAQFSYTIMPQEY